MIEAEAEASGDGRESGACCACGRVTAASTKIGQNMAFFVMTDVASRGQA